MDRRCSQIVGYLPFLEARWLTTRSTDSNHLTSLLTHSISDTSMFIESPCCMLSFVPIQLTRLLSLFSTHHPGPSREPPRPPGGHLHFQLLRRPKLRATMTRFSPPQRLHKGFRPELPSSKLFFSFTKAPLIAWKITTLVVSASLASGSNSTLVQPTQSP